jgi:predicted nucleic acid-binding protein
VIVLDTNVLSALMRTEPEAAVLGWLDRQAPDAIWITAVTVFEVRMGLALLPAGRRRRALETAFERLLAEDLQHRVLGFDASAATRAAALAAARQSAGRSVDLRDTQIAGIVSARRATLATRDLRHFRDLDVAVVDPWS